MQPATANILPFRALLEARFPEAHAVRQMGSAVLTGIPCVDAVGITPGHITEFVSPLGSSGAGLLLTALLEGADETLREQVALVDGADTFDPRTLSPQALGRLLWLRCRDVQKAVRAADLLLRDGNIPRVLLDLQLCPERAVRQIPSQAWHRLRLLAEKSGAALCAFTPFQAVPCARSRLLLDRQLPLEVLDVARPDLLTSLNGRVIRRGALLEPLTVPMPVPMPQPLPMAV
ncbi:MAG TPA: hypothetical protein VLE43_18310 [Candidatus Saccharimonadia bacterium]|nr:hypothetical protein [Candidatus Saccharimonadia bacterium]